MKQLKINLLLFFLTFNFMSKAQDGTDTAYMYRI